MRRTALLLVAATLAWPTLAQRADPKTLDYRLQARALAPGVWVVPGTGGIFRVMLGEQLLWDRKQQGGFPELKTLKQIVRDSIAPDRPLGHSDNPASRAVEPDA